jgi:hypothetical protein
LKLLIPCNLRTRRLLQVSDLYRGFEFTPLRHAVSTAEKLPRRLPRNMRKMPIFHDNFAANRTAENGLPDSEGGNYHGFLRRAHAKSGFSEAIKRMECDHKPGIWQ